MSFENYLHVSSPGDSSSPLSCCNLASARILTSTLILGDLWASPDTADGSCLPLTPRVFFLFSL